MGERDSTIRRPDIWKNPQVEILSLREKANEAVLNLVFEVTHPLADMVSNGVGRNAIGEVLGREEDEQIAIDATAESLARESLEQSARSLGVSFFVLSEHNNFQVGSGMPEFIGVLDPFDNSDEHKKGLDTPAHVVFGVYDLEGNPLAAADSNLYTRHIYINRDGKNYLYNSRTGKLDIISPRRVESIQDENFVVASYLGRYQYASLFNASFDVLNQDRYRRSTLHGKGGAHIYAYLSTGAVSAYVMFDEPRGEVDPGLPFALSASCTVVSVHPDGTFEDYKFNPDLQRDTVPLFIAASTPKLRDEIIDYYLKAQRSA